MINCSVVAWLSISSDSGDVTSDKKYLTIYGVEKLPNVINKLKRFDVNGSKKKEDN